MSNSVTVVENSHFCQKLLDLFIFYLKKVNFPKDRTCKILSGCGKTIIYQQLTRKKANSFQDFQDPCKACILKLFATFPHFPQALIIIILLNISYILIQKIKFCKRIANFSSLQSNNNRFRRRFFLSCTFRLETAERCSCGCCSCRIPQTHALFLPQCHHCLP